VRKADNLPPSCAVVMKSGNLNFLELSGALQACNGTAFTICFRKCSSGDHVLLHNTISTYNWSSLYNDASVNAAVDILFVVVTQTIETTVPTLCSKKCKFLCFVFFCFENLKYYINKINHFYRRLKKCIGSKSFCNISFVMHLPEDGHKCGRNM